MRSMLSGFHNNNGILSDGTCDGLGQIIMHNNLIDFINMDCTTDGSNSTADKGL